MRAARTFARIASRSASMMLVAAVLAGCAERAAAPLEGRPGGPYRLTLTLDPPAPRAGEEIWLTFRLRFAASGEPVRDLQVAHERVMHNFIVNLDFSSFAHIHHEDFAPLGRAERDTATLRFPYRFPKAGRYRVVSEFAHRNRSWTKHFDIEVGHAGTRRPAPADLRRTRWSGPYTATLALSPAMPLAGFETALELRLARDGAPVRDLALYLGSELHGAVWREDGRYFGHLHSYTPRVAAIMALAHDRGVAPELRGARIAQMMVQLMCLESELVFPGPTIPMRYVFPRPGRYRLFLQVAPGGEPRVFPFVVDVAGAEDDAPAPGGGR